MSYVVLRGRWCNIIVVNVRGPNDEKNDDAKDSIYEKLQKIFAHFGKYYMKIL